MEVNKIHETIIIGGGISGLSCARRLHDAGRDFLLISKELGGRMLMSKSFGMDYGAIYATEDYHNVLKYVEKEDRVRLRDFFIFDGSGYSTIFSLRNIRLVPQLFRLLYFVKKLRKHINQYQKKAPLYSIKECIEADPLLLEYWSTPATDFIKKHHLEKIDEYIGNPATTTMTFLYLEMFLWIVSKTWVINFRHTISKLTKGYEDKILLATVHKIHKQLNVYFIETSHGIFHAKHVVIAAPQMELDAVYNLPKPHLQQSAYIFHVVGRRREEFQGKCGVLFRPKHHDIYMLWKQKSGADIVYSKHPDPDFKQYYETYHVVHRVHWHPGIIIPGKEIIPQKLEDNLYLASDYNISGLEDSFLTGLYAANQIIKKP